jgi:hypothetical protein
MRFRAPDKTLKLAETWIFSARCSRTQSRRPAFGGLPNPELVESPHRQAWHFLPGPSAGVSVQENG